jgi:hypothetical protein
MGTCGLDLMWLRVCDRSTLEAVDSGGSEPSVAMRDSGCGDKAERSVIVPLLDGWQSLTTQTTPLSISIASLLSLLNPSRHAVLWRHY